MSTFSQDLDFFDISVFKPVSELTKKSPSNVSLKSDFGILEESVTEEEQIDDRNDFSSVGKDFVSDEEEIEEEEKSQSGGEEQLDEEKTSEKDDKSSNEFSIDLWSARDSASLRSFDSWNLPKGTVPWDDNGKPIERILNFADLSLTEEEENGLLTDRIVAACSSYLTESPEHKCHVVAKVSLTNKNLNDIRILGYHRFLQYVDLSWNNLTDLTPLGCIPYLMYLDVSHNLIEEVLRFRPPLNLTYVNYSYNEVWRIDDLSDFWTLCYLDLSHNKIAKIQGLHNLRYLRYLDLSHNRIERLENLINLKLTDLNLEYNLISKFESHLKLNVLPNLTNFYLSNNLINNTEFLKHVYHLKKLELQGNYISDLAQLNEMKHLKHLLDLDLSGNPVSLQKPYRNLVLNLLPDLRFLDQTEVDVSERVAASSKHRYDVQLEAARNNARMILLEQLNDTTLGLDVLPVDQGCYPFVILVGPAASSKKYIISCLAEKYPEKIYIGKLYTTRKVVDGEKHLLEQTTREKFNDMIKSGKFLCVSENLGHFYGFCRDEIGKAIREQKLCLTALDMVSALTIHSYGIRPFLVLSILQSKEEHTKRVKLTYGPVLSSLGAAYVAQRQLVDTHESNIKRVESVLDEVIKRVLQNVPESIIEYEECPTIGEARMPSGSWELNTEEKSIETLSNMENSLDTIYNGSPKICYPCTPNKCGYQTCRTLPKKPMSSVASEESQRWDSSAEEHEEETSTTSYSTNKLYTYKREFSSSDEISFGEHDPFAEWSLPFIEWSEVNLTGLQLEEAAEVLCEKYIENVMSTRDIYQNLHLDNPGLFSLCVFTDVASKAIKTIGKFLQEVYRATPDREPTYDVKDDLVYKAFVPQKLNQLKEMLQNDFLSLGEEKIKEHPEVEPINSPVSICREMQHKGYGDSVDDLY